MRTINSIKNLLISMLTNTIVIAIGFIIQKIFLQTLGLEYSGINGLFTNIISMLSIVELGIGSAIIYNLYQPIASNDREKIKSLMHFYKITYRVVCVIIFVIGISIIPFLKFIVAEEDLVSHMNLIFILFLGDTIVSYLLAYKRSILYANQKNYIINLVHIGYLILMNSLQILILLLFKDFILFLIVKIIFRIIENIVLNVICDKIYPFINEKNVNNLDIETKQDIFKKVKGLIFHKIGSFVVLGTDNIIISKFLGIVTVGLYNNYYLIISALQNVLGQAFAAITASVGNLLIEKDEQKSYDIYKKILLFNSWIYAFASAGILCLTEPFIKLWIGEQYLLPYFVLIVLVTNFYVQGMRKTCLTFKTADGVFYEDRFVPIIEAISNMIFSIVLVNFLGLAGVFLGTIISSLVLFLYSYPVFVYKKLFKRKFVQFISEYLKYAIITAISVLISVFIIRFIIVDNIWIQLFINSTIVLIVPNVIYCIFFCKTDEFKYYYGFIKRLQIRKRKIDF